MGSLESEHPWTVTDTYNVNIVADKKESPGMESIFALSPSTYLHDAIMAWWSGYWCTKTGGISNYTITRHTNRTQTSEHGQGKTFFATPFSWIYVENHSHPGGVLVWDSPRREGVLPAGDNRGNWNVTWLPTDV